MPYFLIVKIKSVRRQKFSSITFFPLKIDSITLEPNPNWAKIQDPDPNSMYFDPQRWKVATDLMLLWLLTGAMKSQGITRVPCRNINVSE